MKKNYVLDANILLHDPASIYNFADNTVVVPVGVLSELDRFKKEMTGRGYNARAVARLLDSLRDHQSLIKGVALPNGGTLKVYCDPARALRGGPVDGDLEILRVAHELQESDPKTPVIIVSKDINLRIRADVTGLRAEDYESDRVSLSDLDTEDRTLTVEPEDLQAFKDHGEREISDDSLHVNEYVLLQSSSGKGSALARVNADCSKLVALLSPKDGICGVRPRNKEQYYAIDALLSDDVSLATLMGKAGTGKTLLAIAAAMYSTIVRQQFRGVLVCRPVVPLGRDMGFLPGDIEQKLAPWMKPIMDTLDFLLEAGGAIGGHRDAQSLIESGVVEIQPLAYIRGRSIANRYVVIDEAQNLTPLEVKTVITRMGEAAKVILTGDPDQIDNPYIDAHSNGLIYLVNRLRHQPQTAHIALVKGERSQLAEMAADLL